MKLMSLGRVLGIVLCALLFGVNARGDVISGKPYYGTNFYIYATWPDETPEAAGITAAKSQCEFQANCIGTYTGTVLPSPLEISYLGDDGRFLVAIALGYTTVNGVQYPFRAPIVVSYDCPTGYQRYFPPPPAVVVSCLQVAARPPARTVTVDAGHGGLKCKRDAGGNPITGGDTGATGPTNFSTPPIGNLTEHALAFDIANKLQGRLIANGDVVVMTRKDDRNCPTLDERAEIANNAGTKLFASIHFNSLASPSANGSQAWYQPTKTGDRELATIIVNNIASGLGLVNRGPKAAGIDGKNLRVLNQTRMNSVLAEVGFLSNPGDEAVMHSAAANDLTAEAMYLGIIRYLP